MAVDIIMKTLEAFNKETGDNCLGFLYGQFMLTSDGIKLVEYNFRPGDPEWMNTLSVIENNVVDIISFLLDGIQKPIDFEDNLTGPAAITSVFLVYNLSIKSHSLAP